MICTADGTICRIIDIVLAAIIVRVGALDRISSGTRRRSNLDSDAIAHRNFIAIIDLALAVSWRTGARRSLQSRNFSIDRPLVGAAGSHNQQS